MRGRYCDAVPFRVYIIISRFSQHFPRVVLLSGCRCSRCPLPFAVLAGILQSEGSLRVLCALIGWIDVHAHPLWGCIFFRLEGFYG